MKHWRDTQSRVLPINNQNQNQNCTKIFMILPLCSLWRQSESSQDLSSSWRVEFGKFANNDQHISKHIRQRILLINEPEPEPK